MAFAPCAAQAQPGDAPANFPAREPKAAQPAESTHTQWMIVLVSFRGDEQRALAAEMLKGVQEKGLPEAFLESRGPATVIGIGQFDEPTSRKAQDELARVRSIQIDGVRPFALAFFSPPDTQTAMGGRPEYNLVKAREQFGEEARFTLQVASYGPADLNHPREGEREQAKADAEQGAAILRKEGELAFYYHGPNYSMVTIGVWDEKAFGVPADPMDDDPTLRAARKRFPYCLYNGGGVKIKASPTSKAQLQRSTLVKVPEP